MSTPVPMILHCPKCGMQHIDKPNFWADENAPCDPPNANMQSPEDFAENHRLLREYELQWTNPPHRSHLCHGCGTIWRPSDVATTGVVRIMTARPLQALMSRMDCELDDDHPQWLVNEQIKGLLECEGAPEDHQGVIDFLRSTGLPDGTVTLVHLAIAGNLNARRWLGFVKALTGDDMSFTDMLEEADPETPEEFNAVMDRWLAQQQ